MTVPDGAGEALREEFRRLLAERDDLAAKVAAVRELVALNPGTQWSRSVYRALGEPT